MKRIAIISILTLSLAGAVLLLQTQTASAAILDQACNGISNDVCNKKGDTNINSLVLSVINLLLYIVAVVAVVMIIVGGMKYLTSSGDSGKVTSAKNTVVYAVVGLLVAIFSWVIVNFIVKQFV